MIQQVIVNGIVAASTILLVALGFWLVFRVAGLFHFAHGAVFTLGAYLTFLFHAWIGFSLVISIPLAIISATLIGCLLELAIYRPIRHKGGSALVLLLASLGVYVVIQNLVSMVFGDDTESLRLGAVLKGIPIAGARITCIQVMTICVSGALLTALEVFLRKTKIGKALRAVANDIELANVSGIEGDRIVLWAFGIGSALASLAGILVAFDIDMTPTMGMNALMVGIVAVIVGGEGNIAGVALGALLLGLARHLGVWNISSQWQDAITFVILLAFLLVRPEGFTGKRVRNAVV